MNFLCGHLSMLFFQGNWLFKSKFFGISLFLALSTFSTVKGKNGQCPDCNEEGYIKTIDPKTGNCETCWPCPECQEGAGSSVQCKSSVPRGTDIHCVSCIMGINFSNSSSTEKCQPCGVCSGKHELVSAECSPLNDVECECESGFYRNKTTHECQSCDSCCFSDADDDIIEKCQENVEIKEDGQSEFSPSTVIGTSSPLFKSIKIHKAVTPFLLGFTSILVPSRTQLIQSTPTSVSFAIQRNDVVPTENVIIMNVHTTGHEHGESMKWIRGLTCTMGVSIFIIMCCCLLHLMLKKLRKNRQNRYVLPAVFHLVHQDDVESPGLQRRIDGHCIPDSDESRKNSNTVVSQKDHGVATGDQLENTADKDSDQTASDSLVVDMQGGNQGARCNSTPLPQPVKGNLGYSTCITDVPQPIICKMCRLLDNERVTDENDYRMLGYELGLTPSEISSVKQKSKEPSFVLLMEKFATKPHSGTLSHLKSILEKLERYDVIQVIDNWVQNQTLHTS